MVTDDIALYLLYPPFLYKMLQVGERLGGREAQPVVGELLGEDPVGDVQGCGRPAVERGVQDRQPHLVVPKELVYAPVEVVKERPVSRKNQVYFEPSQALERIQVAFQGMRAV